MEKQIEIKKMANTLLSNKVRRFGEIDNVLTAERVAQSLYDAGYRKTADVVRNIFGNLRILGHIDFDGNFCIRKDSFEALEKKYESEVE